MKNKNLWVGPVLAWACALLSCLLSVSALALPDVLERPAMLATRLDQRVLLAITAAGSRLVAVGEQGLVLLSDDQGKSWRQAQVPVSVTLTNAYFVDPQQGWAVGHSGVVLHSTNGGQTWRKQLDGRQVAQLLLATAQARQPQDRLQMAEAQRLVADGPDKPFLDVHFLDARHGLVVGAYGLALSTDDGGQRWTPLLNIPNPQGKHLYRIASTGQDLYIAGEQGALFRSSDRGRYFVALPSPYEGSFFGLIAERNGLLLVFGLRGNLFRSQDAGQSWQTIDSGASVALVDGLRVRDGSLLLIDQSGRLLSSQDDGHSFRRLPITPLGPVASVAETESGKLLLSGLHGITSVPLTSLSAGAQQ
ncbi:Ycf48-like protein precursor [compost metagenome]